jgi:hypothetical protein
MSLAPQRGCDRRARPRDLVHGLVRHKANGARAQRDQGVIHHVQMEALQVGDVARNVERKNLALSILRHLGAVEISFHQKTAARGPVPFVGDDGPGGQFCRREGKVLDRREVIVVKRRMGAKLARQRLGETWSLPCHETRPSRRQKSCCR